MEGSGVAEWPLDSDNLHSDSCVTSNQLGNLTGSQFSHQEEKDSNSIYVIGSVSLDPNCVPGCSDLYSQLPGALWKA